MAVRSPGTQLWYNRDFNIFWAGRTLSALGDAFALVALPLLMLELTGSVAQMGLVTSASGISLLLTGLVAGIIVDRYNRRAIMILCDIARAFLYAAIPLVWLLVQPTVWVLFVVAVGASAFSILFQVAYVVVVPALVHRDQITIANGRMQTTIALMAVCGPMMAGIVSAWFGPVAAIGLNVCTFLISAVSLTGIDLPKHETPQPPKGTQPSVVSEMGAGFRFLLKEPALRSVTIILFSFILIVSGGYDLFIFHLKENLGQDDAAIGFVFGIASLGAVLGGFIGPWIRTRYGFGACFLGGMFLESLSILCIGLTPNVVWIAVFAMIMIFANTLKLLSSLSLRQQLTPDHVLGRVTASFWLIIRIPRPFGTIVTTAIADRFGVLIVVICMGILGMLVPLIGLLTNARNKYPETKEPPRVEHTR